MEYKNLSNRINNYWFEKKHYFGMKKLEKFNKYFFSFLVNENKNLNSKIKIYDIRDYNENINSENINILLCIENCLFWKHYKDCRKFVNYDNENISIYLYNHINRYIEKNNYIIIPIIYLQIDYFMKYNQYIKPNKFIPFEKKKFCLFVSNIKPNSNLNKKKIRLIKNILRRIGRCDEIKKFKHFIKNESCYHSIKMLNLFNRYKFIFCFENSLRNGYITEKIFNVFFSRSIPIYLGPNDTLRYFNDKSFINMRNIDMKKFINIKKIKNNKKIFNRIINSNKIKRNFNNENYIERSNIFIKKIFE